jgi:hypothetical protein
MATALRYFDYNVVGVTATEGHFNDFTVIWHLFLSTGRFPEGENLRRRALEPALEWKQINAVQRVHKGTAHYFWGMTSLLRRARNAASVSRAWPHVRSCIALRSSESRGSRAWASTMGA